MFLFCSPHNPHVTHYYPLLFISVAPSPLPLLLGSPAPINSALSIPCNKSKGSSYLLGGPDLACLLVSSPCTCASLHFLEVARGGMQRTANPKVSSLPRKREPRRGSVCSGAGASDGSSSPRPAVPTLQMGPSPAQAPSQQPLCLPSRGEGACTEFKRQVLERQGRPDFLVSGCPVL